MKENSFSSEVNQSWNPLKHIFREHSDAIIHLSTYDVRAEVHFTDNTLLDISQTQVYDIDALKK